MLVYVSKTRIVPSCVTHGLCLCSSIKMLIIAIMQTHIYATEFFIRLVFFLFYISLLYEAGDGKLCRKSLNNHIKYLHYYEDIILFERIARDAKWCNGERTCIGWSIAHFSSCEINGRFRCNLNLIDHLSLFSFDSKKSDLVKLKVLKSIQEIGQGAHNWTYFVKKPDEQRWLLRQNHKLRAES